MQNRQINDIFASQTEHTVIQVANYNTLRIERATDNGLYLIDDEHNEVLLPNRYVPQEYQIGDPMRVFVYFDSEDRIVACTETPKLIDGGIACLQVAGFNFHGAFLDWGLPKDLFVPKVNQTVPMQVGGWYTVTLYVDNVSGRPVGTAKIGKLVNNDDITVRVRESVSVLVALRLERGFRVIINNKHWGMLYDNQIFTDVKLGDTLTGYVSRITEDNRIDISLQKSGFDQVKVAADDILKLIDEHDGVLPLGDQSTPEQVRLTTGMSKKVFKRSVGHLMSQGIVIVGDNTTERTKTKKI